MKKREILSAACVMTGGIAACIGLLALGARLIENGRALQAGGDGPPMIYVADDVAPVELLDEAEPPAPKLTFETEARYIGTYGTDTPTISWVMGGSCAAISATRKAGEETPSHVMVDVDCMRRTYPDATIEVKGHGARAEF